MSLMVEFWKVYGEYRAMHRNWRNGQCCFNALHTVSPELANKIRGTDADPFYRDSAISAFFKEIGLE